MNKGVARLHTNERGSALLIALLATVFLTILGLIIMTILRNSLMQAASSEASIQAEVIAQKGLDEVESLILNIVNQVNGDGILDYAGKVDQINDHLNSLLANIDGSEVDALRGRYKIEIADGGNNYDQFRDHYTSGAHTTSFPYSRIIDVHTTGTIYTHPKREVSKSTKIIVSTINPVFKYPVSARENLSLNGASYIVGDIISQNIHVHEKSIFSGEPGTIYHKEADLPSVQGFYKAASIKEVDPLNFSESEMGPFFSKKQAFKDMLMPDIVQIDVRDDYVDEKMNDLITKLGSVSDEEPPNNEFIRASASTGFEGIVIEEDITTRYMYLDDWVTINSVSQIDRDLAVKRGVLRLTDAADVTMNGGSLYVQYPSPHIAAADLSGSLHMGVGHAVLIDGNAVFNDGFHFDGNMYIDGGLEIIGSVTVNGTIFVTGDVELKQVRSINVTDDPDADTFDKTLILVVDGTINFSDSRPADDTDITKIRAFFYTTEDINLYGVQTKLDIQGGIHGKNVMLSAVREDEPSNLIEESYGSERFLFSYTAQQEMMPEQSNLKVMYDFTLYTDPPVGIPVTDDVTMFTQKQ